MAPGTRGSSSARSSTASRPRSIFSISAGRSRRPAKRSGQAPAQRVQDGARREDVGEGQRSRWRRARPWCAGCRGRSRAGSPRCRRGTRCARATSRSGGKTSRMPPRRATWPGGGDRVLAPVAALVERLEQDLRRQLVAGGDRDHARLEQVAARGSAGAGPAGEATRRAHAGRERGVEGGGAPERGVRRGAAGRGRAAGPGRGREGPRPATPASAASVRRSSAALLDLALVRHDHEQRARPRPAAGRRSRAVPVRPWSGEATSPAARASRSRARRGRSARRPASQVRQARSRLADPVERRRWWTVPARARRAPRARPRPPPRRGPRSGPAAQSAPFTSTSGRRAATIARGGVSRRRRRRASTASRASSASARSSSGHDRAAPRP